MGLAIALFLLTAGESEAQPSRAAKLAPLSSLLLPGSGELIRGYRLKGEMFLWADGLTLTGVVGFGWDAANKRRASQGFAVMNAGANPDNRSKDYLSAIEAYLSSEDYNLDVARDARRKYPDDLTAQQDYIAAHSYTDGNAWVWPSDSVRLMYLEQRNSMRRAWQTSQALMGVMVLSRLLSAFDVAFLSPPQTSGVGFMLEPTAPGVRVFCRF